MEGEAGKMEKTGGDRGVWVDNHAACLFGNSNIRCHLIFL